MDLQFNFTINIDGRFYKFIKKTITMRKLFLGLLLAVVATTLNASELNTFIGGKTIKSSEVNQNFADLDSRITDLETYAGFGYVPIGTILSWHKNAVTPELSLPTGWVECDGATVSVATDGPLDPDGDGQYTVPDLNSSNLFLAGGSTSGTTAGSHTVDIDHDHSMNQASYKIPSHQHQSLGASLSTVWGYKRDGSTLGLVTIYKKQFGTTGSYYSYAKIVGETSSRSFYTRTDGGGGATTRSTNASVNALGSTATENRPGFMSVLWIMRVR